MEIIKQKKGKAMIFANIIIGSNIRRPDQRP